MPTLHDDCICVLGYTDDAFLLNSKIPLITTGITLTDGVGHSLILFIPEVHNHYASIIGINMLCDCHSIFLIFWCAYRFESALKVLWAPVIESWTVCHPFLLVFIFHFLTPAARFPLLPLHGSHLT
jgi:hypothetical protein